jgi:hypothetical protein
MFRKLGSVLTAAIFITTCAVPGTSQKETFVDGLWSHENTIVLVARFDKCGGPYRPVQSIVSTDGGNTWAADGPQFNGIDLLFMLSEGAELLIGGQYYAEGPTSSPFLLVYDLEKHEWSQSDIFDGSAELLGMAREKETGHLLAWVRHIDMESENDSGSIFLHESVDGGKTWGLIKDVAHVPTSMPGMNFFSELPQRSEKWRVSPDGNAIEHLTGDGKWHRSVKLPMAIQQQCPENQDNMWP